MIKITDIGMNYLINSANTRRRIMTDIASLKFEFENFCISL